MLWVIPGKMVSTTLGKPEPSTESYLDHLEQSREQLARGDLELAQRHLLEALRINPRHAETYNNLGSLYYRQGRITEALRAFEKALRLDPTLWEAHYNCANCFAKKDQMEQAALHYTQVVLFQPQHVQAQYHLGLCYVALEDFSKAEKPLLQTLTLDPKLTEAARQLGHVSIALGKIEQAMALFQQVLEQSDNLHTTAEAHHNLAVLFLRSENSIKALEHFEKALQCDPHNPTAQHLCVALKGLSTPSTAPLAYVEQLFDQYAPYYNQHLKQTLNYTLPSQLRNAMGRFLKPSAKAGRVLDLGCGTGLCGIMFRDLALELVGIDLSKKMIREATQLGSYEQLIQGDYQSYLKDPTLLPFDIIIAGDVLVYLGALEDLFESLNKALVPEGSFVFSIENSRIPDKDYTLNPSGRFSHTAAYLEKLCERHNLCLLLQEPVLLRTTLQQPIQGTIMLLQKRL